MRSGHLPQGARRRASLVAAVVLGVGSLYCQIPAFFDLGEKACDSAHPCIEDYVCEGGICRPDEGFKCADEDATYLCGTNNGECVTGLRTCQNGALGVCVGHTPPASELCNGLDEDCDNVADNNLAEQGAPCPLSQGVCEGTLRACVSGAFEPVCTTASYGPDYDEAEVRCDGKDNDCDGTVDRDTGGGQLRQDCPLQQGVCSGARTTCTAGAYPACDEAAYTAHNARYQPVELACDGFDNDCDTRTDTWALTNVSGSSSTTSTRPVAVGLIDGSTLLLYQEGPRIVARTLLPDGGFAGPAQTPSITIDGVLRAYAPALAVSGSTVVAAWVEELASNPASQKRLMVAPLDSDGRSSMTYPDGGRSYGAAAAWGPPVNPTSLSVSINGGRVQVVMQDDVDPARPEIRGVNLSELFNGDYLKTHINDGGSPGVRPHVAAAGGGEFSVVYERAGGNTGIELRRINSTGNPISAPLVVSPSGTNPHVFPTATNTRVYYVSADADTLEHESCTTVCSSQPSLATGSSIAEVRLVGPSLQPATVGAWQEGTDVVVGGFRPDGGSFKLSLGPGRHPAVTHPNGPTERRTFYTFDTEGTFSPDRPTNEVFWAPLCF